MGSIELSIICIIHFHFHGFTHYVPPYFAPPFFMVHIMRPILCAPYFALLHFASPHFAPCSLRPILCTQHCASALYTPHFAPHSLHLHTMRPNNLHPPLCVPIIQHFAISINSLLKLLRNIHYCRPILFSPFVYALIKQNQCFWTHN